MRDPKEIQEAIDGFRLAVQLGRSGAGTPEDRMANVMVADALDWALGNEPEKFTRVIRHMRMILAGIKADSN